eukprot:jgi/Hompol1/2919/HPOL_006229-RA
MALVAAAQSTGTGVDEDEDADMDMGIQGKSLECSAALPLQDITSLGRISLSSFKPGNGVDKLRDGSYDTFWQ